MAYNGSGVWVTPTGQPVVTGTVISSPTFNTLVSDIASTFNNVVTRDGQGPMTAPFKLQSGTVTIPGLSFNAESSTGLYWPSTGMLAITTSGVEIARFKSDGAVLINTTADDGVNKLQVSGGITGTTLGISGAATVGSTLAVTGALNVTGAITSASSVAAAAASGFVSTTYVSNARNPIWNFGNAPTFGLSYFQGTSGLGGVNDSLGFHFGTATAAASTLNISATGATVTGTLNVTGLATANNFQSTSATITGGSLNNASVGASTPSTGAFTTINASNNSSAIKANLSTSAGYNGFQVADQAGSRKLELLYLGTGQGGAYGAAAGSAVINAAGGTGLTLSTQDNAALVISGSQYVGIGQAPNGSYRLAVNSSNNGVLVTSPSGSPQLTTTDGNVTAYIGYSSGSSTSAVNYLGTSSSHAQAFLTGNVERMRITSTGAIGFNMTPTTQFDFSVGGGMLRVGSGGGNNMIQAYSSGGTLGLWAGGSSAIYSNSALYFTTGATTGTGTPTGGTTAMTIDTSGNVGVGVTPTAKLHVGGTIQSTSGSTAAQLYSDGTAAYLGSSGAYPLLFMMNGSERARIDTSGNLLAGGKVIQGGASTSPSQGFIGSTGYQLVAAGQSGATATGYWSTKDGGSTFNGWELSMDTSYGFNLFVGDGSSQWRKVMTVNQAGNTSFTGAVAATSIATSNIITSTTTEAFRVENDTGYISFFNTANSTRNGYLQGNTSGNVTLAAENGYLALSSTTGSVNIVTGGGNKLTVSSTGVIADGAGNELGYKGIPVQTNTFVNGQCNVITAGTTINTSATGYTYGIFNNSATAVTLTQGTGLTLRQGGTTNTGNRTLQPYGYATIWFPSASVCVIIGNIT